MTEREEQAVVVLNTLHDNPLLSDIHRQALEVGIMAIKALSSSENPNTCGDAISRQAVLKIIDGWYDNNRDTENIEDLIVLITYMCSVNPQKPKSEWEHDHEILKAYSDGANAVLDKIRDEIEQMNNLDYVEPVTVHEVLQIIDKHIEEVKG